MGWTDNNIGWTDERAATCKKLWLEGLSASQIAKQLGGVTRNAVIGKIHRLGLTGRASPSKPRPHAYRAPSAPRPISKRAPRRVAQAANVAVFDTDKKPAREPVYREEGPGTATIHTLEHYMCKWPIGDPASDAFTFCGKKASDGHPYCVDHARVAYQPQQAGKKTNANGLARSLRRYI